MRQPCLLTFLLCFHAALQAAKLMVVMQSSNLLFHLIYTCAAVFLLPSFEFELTELLHFTASVMSRKMICSDMSPSRVVFHASFVTAWPLSDVTKNSPPLLLFQQTPSPFKTRGPPPPTLLHGTPPITTTAQNHSTTCRV